jgi:hypothetical protein
MKAILVDPAIKEGMGLNITNFPTEPNISESDKSSLRNIVAGAASGALLYCALCLMKN